MGASQRRKGHNWEREVARQFRAALGLSEKAVKRGLSQPRGGTGEEPDVVLPDSLPWWVECKVGARVNPAGALDQARAGIAAAESRKRPLAVCKPDRRPPFVALELSDFLRLLQQTQQHVGGCARITVFADDTELP